MLALTVQRFCPLTNCDPISGSQFVIFFGQIRNAKPIRKSYRNIVYFKFLIFLNADFTQSRRYLCSVTTLLQIYCKPSLKTLIMIWQEQITTMKIIRQDSPDFWCRPRNGTKFKAYPMKSI